MCNLCINAFVLPVVGEEGSYCRTRLLPFCITHAGNARELPVFIWQAASLPVVHYQEKIAAMLSCSKVCRVGSVVGNVERHPRAVHDATPDISKAIRKSSPSRSVNIWTAHR